MNDKKMSSIDWFVEQIHKNLPTYDLLNFDQKLFFNELVKQAKLMHREDMGKTWDSALDRGQERAWNVMRAYGDFDEYYTEKFEGQDNE